jgi:hypothetical protein
MVLLGDLSKRYKYKCINCNRYFNDIDFEKEPLRPVWKSECMNAKVDMVEVVRCKDCKHGSLYCTEDVCGETLIECNRPDLGDVIEIHGWKWFCAYGNRK